ncbi:hypothetical protein QQM39_23370 [Streptomyces sp. DT2A-34]|uniref:hypothetical protein n=1 Tax=Streptomyces sp. DT2A-34 TaxID=3051182 RepID=UPI00265BD431|nr:hypothetical protein [Streptomyces sp. DT2A-34]MDO0913670.1 hypothetical protein [Streptomyces sp. DT2A-34]
MEIRLLWSVRARADGSETALGRWHQRCAPAVLLIDRVGGRSSGGHTLRTPTECGALYRFRDLTGRARTREKEADTAAATDEQVTAAHRELARPDQARSDAEQALSLARAHSFRAVEAQALSTLCRIARPEAAPPQP